MVFALVSSSWLGNGVLHTECIVLTLECSYREDVAEFFEPSVEAIVDAFEKQRQAAARLQIQIKVSLTPISYSIVISLVDQLVSFGSMLSWSVVMLPVISCTAVCSCTQHFRRCTYADLQITCMYPIIMILSHLRLLSNKAVADGAVSSYIAPLVTSRASKYTYGVECSCPYDQSLSDHRQRRHTRFTLPSGVTVLPNAFSSILQKVRASCRLSQLIVQSSDRGSKFRSGKNFDKRLLWSVLRASN